MRFKGLDLNLLVALDVLLDERNVSRAAERLHLTQPATSAALRRIREYFNDPILKLHGKKMVPTPTALRIKQELKIVLESVDSMVTKSTTFDPSTSTRKFVLTASDYLTQIVFVPLLTKLTKIAPHIQFDILPPADSSIAQLDQGQIDFMLVPRQFVSTEHPFEVIFNERFVVVGCESNPILKNDFSEDDFYNSAQVVVRLGRKRPLSLSNQALLERQRNGVTEIQVASFLLAPEMVVGTNRITVMHERLARHFAARLPISIVPMPFALKGIQECVQYHSARSDDPGLIWIINQIKEELSP